MGEACLPSSDGAYTLLITFDQVYAFESSKAVSDIIFDMINAKPLILIRVIRLSLKGCF